MTDFDAVRMFLRVVERGGFTSTVKHVRVPVSTVSRKVSILENDLGVPLLHRSALRVTVTQAGLYFYENALLKVIFYGPPCRSWRRSWPIPMSIA